MGIKISDFAFTRRHFTQGLAATALAGTVGIPSMARAESAVTFLGWQGYDDPVAFDDFLKDPRPPCPCRTRARPRWAR